MAGAHAEAAEAPPPTWDVYLALPDELRADYADGAVPVHALPTYGHQKLCLRLRDLLTAQLGDKAVVALGVGWLLPGAAGATVRVPDLMVMLEEPVTDIVTSAPPIVAEVLSANRSDDLVLKSPEYLAAGVEQYWILDPRDRVLDLFGRGPAGWERITKLTEADPETVVAVPELGTVTLALPPLLR
jgi:Uma2 family endonuclease